MSKELKALERKVIEVRRHRVPLTKLFNGLGFREGLAELDKWRCENFNEDEILYGRHLKWRVSYGEAEVIVWRHETDAEYDARLEKNRIARERREAAAKVKAEKQRKAEEAKAKLAAKIPTLTLDDIMKHKNWSVEDMLRFLKVNEPDVFDKLLK